MKKTMSLLTLAILLSTTSAFADQVLSPSNPDITTPNCGAHAYFVPGTDMVIVDMPSGKCSNFVMKGVTSEGRIMSDGVRLGLTRGPGKEGSVTLLDPDHGPTLDKITIVFP